MAVELLSPAGDFETALAAFDAGADAVYCGLGDFSARAFATNFSIEDLKNLMRVARKRNKRVYVTFNTLVDEADVESAVRALSDLEVAAPSAVIVQDLGIARICREYFPSLELHASTQLVAHNLEGVLQLKELGFKRVVLARELSLEEIASISKRCGDVELEAFIHGALCYSISGLCLYSAMEKGRSGNRGKCAYCCRASHKSFALAGDDGSSSSGASAGIPAPPSLGLPVITSVKSCTERQALYPFSMKDLRLGEDVRKLIDAGVVSLKIEGRMKSALYVASVTKFYRQILDGSRGVTQADLETVFSRRTTELYLNGRPHDSVIDPNSLGHLGTPIGTVKKVTKDREGLCWLRFHTARALEKHDGLQFASPDGGKPLGLGISEMRQALSRTPVFEVAAGTDVEILLPLPERGENAAEPSIAASVRPGDTVYCSMSNAVKRMFPPPQFRPSDYPGNVAIDLEVELSHEKIIARVGEIEVAVEGKFEPAKSPDKTFGAIEKAFSKLGDTDYRLGKLKIVDADRLFAPMSSLNDLRRDLVEALDTERGNDKRRRLDRALADDASADEESAPLKTLKIRAGMKVPAGEWDELIVAINADTALESIPEHANVRLALPVYTAEPNFNRLRIAVKRFLRAGYGAWEAADLATLRMLRELEVTDITADWSLYAFNASALKTLSGLGVKRFVASPENGRDNLQYLSESGYSFEFLKQQSTPLFISLTEPAATPSDELAVFRRDGLFVTVRRLPRVFDVPDASSTRIDLSWSPEVA